ncbi:HNH endonuclease signature motif containing protein [Arsenicicoccus sp. oral taxon 190]|uniref:HNH endonuclease signature motif containing protein n=1 Tax=Arsenicicoccus sp. oral taxon 190 TaxID=1658671 RepID=UPI00067E3DF0|nr:HNH endonuclease signature motif containing protein [Arsenicicoccus sp. oral taxon 190]
MQSSIVDGLVDLARTGFSSAILNDFRTEMLTRFGSEADQDREHDHQQAVRGVTGWRLLDDGMWRCEATLTPTDKAVVDAAITALAAPQPADDGTTDTRSPAARRADALVTLCGIASGQDTTGPMGATTRVTLTLPVEALTGEAAAHDELGTPLLPAAARELSCGATLTTVVLGVHGEPLQVGREHRTATAAQRRALAVRDRGCTFPGCDAPPSWTQAHHITHWIDGGATDLDNLALLCHRHHRSVHRYRITGAVRDDGSGVDWDVVRTGLGWRPPPPPDPWTRAA